MPLFVSENERMYQKILIANRADCAMRLIRGVHELGASAVVAMAMDDPLTLVRGAADEVAMTGASRDAFLNPTNLIEAARQHHCEAILPGWGFLSEDPYFAQQCRLAGIHYIGPSTPHLYVFGDKYETLRLLSQPLGLEHRAIRCDDGDFETRLRTEPMDAWVLKRRTGGGGKGVFPCRNKDSLLDTRARLICTEPASQFYVEPLIVGRHIEFQLFGDGAGCVKVLGIRDCSAQKHCQKWLERHVPFQAEAWLLPFVKKVERVFSELHYRSWGTLETLVDDNGNIHLLEVNPRLQVEHGVTEMATGVDLVHMAVKLACYGQCDELNRMANDVPKPVDVVEYRLFANATGPAVMPAFEGAEWPDHPFMADPDYRLETGYMPGERVTGVYDGLIARFIVRGEQGTVDQKLRRWIGDIPLA